MKLPLYRFTALPLYRFTALPLYRFTALPLYTLMLLLLLKGDALAQNNGLVCGSYIAVPPSHSSPDSLVYDRFGNSFDIEDLVIPPASNGLNPIRKGGLNYFTTTEYGDPPPGLSTVLNEVLSYISNTIIQQQGQNNCNQSFPLQQVELQIVWLDFSNPDVDLLEDLEIDPAELPSTDVAAIGTPFYEPGVTYNSCRNVEPERTYIKINGGSIDVLNSTVDIFDGRIIINSYFVPFPECPSGVSWNFNSTATNFPCQGDLFSVLLHEMMHVLGFSSALLLPEQYYTIWDQSLRLVDNYIPNETSLNPEPVLVNPSECIQNCWQVIENYSAVSSNSCSDPSIGKDLVLGDEGIAPIFSNVNLTHLSTDCNGQNIDYVMKPSLSLNSFQRQITIPELKILCELGYKINSADPSFNCTGCFNIAQEDKFYNYDVNPCCWVNYHGCLGEIITVSTDLLLCNDLTNDISQTITQMWVNGANVSSVNIQQNVNGLDWDIILPAQLGNINYFNVYYTVSSCDCRLENSFFTVVVNRDCPDCNFTPEDCDNLFCTSNFDIFAGGSNYSKTITTLGGEPFIITGMTTAASVDAIFDVNTGNHYLHFDNAASNREGIYFSLSECIEPGCKLSLNMDLASNSLNNTFSTVEIWGSNTPPCSAAIPTAIPIAANCGVITNCPTYDFNPYCISSFTAVTSLPIFTPINPIIWTNTNTENVCYITIIGDESVPDNEFYIDNISAFKICTCADFTIENNCPEINFNSTILPNTSDHLWDFGDNTSTSIDENPTHIYSLPGTFVITHTVTDECGNTASSTQIVTIDCISEACLCPPESQAIYNIGTPGNPLQAINVTVSGLPTDAVGDVCINVYGNLVINQDYAITNSTLVMHPGSAITINGHIVFTSIENHYLGCDKMWRGINMIPEAEIVFKSNIIEDARIAINTANKSYAWIVDNEFRKNYIGIRSPTYYGLNQFEGNEFHCEGLQLIDPYDGQTPTPGHISYAGMNLVQQLGGMTYGTVGTTTILNSFHHMSNGIISENAYFEINGAEFRDMIVNGDYSLEGYGIHAKDGDFPIVVNGMGMDDITSPASFDNCPSGAIYVSGMGLLADNNRIVNVEKGVLVFSTNDQDINITGNRIVSEGIGIRLSTCQGASNTNIQGNNIDIIPLTNSLARGILISDVMPFSNRANIEANSIHIFGNSNGIEVNSTGNFDILNNQDIELQDPPHNRSGIRIVNCSDLTCRWNNIVGGNTTSGGIQSNAAISVTATTNAIYCCNMMHHTRFGAQFSGLCNSTTFHGNIFDNHNIGLHLKGSTTTLGMVQDNAGNQWLGTAADYNFMAICESNNCNSSAFLTTGLLLPFRPPTTSLDPQIDWFGLSNSTNDPTPCPNDNNCTQEAMPPMLMSMINESDMDIASDDLEFTDFEEELTWMAKRYLYEKLTKNPDLVDINTIVDGFWEDASNGNIGFLQSIVDEKKSLFLVSEIIRSLLADKNDMINTAMLSMKAIDLQMPDNPDDPAVEILSDQKKVIYETEIEPAMVAVASAMESIKSDRTMEADIVKLVNSSVSTNSELYTENEKVVNDIYLSNIAAQIIQPTPEQMSILIGIAHQCPLAGGNPVYQARSLISPWYDVEYDDDYTCGQLGYEMLHAQNPVTSANLNHSEELSASKTGISIADFEVYPNPAKEEFTISCTLSGDIGGNLFISNVSGQTIVEIPLHEGSNLQHFSTRDFPSGFYMVVIRNPAGVVIYHSKFSIIK